jgi:hypothetical protein
MDPITGSLIGIGLGGTLSQIGNAQQLEQQQAMMQQQYQNQMGLNLQGAQIARDNWDYTNYENQRKHMEKAGLNVGLMYGQSGGGGGTLSSGNGGSAASGNAPQNVMGMALQGAQIASQTRLNEAQAKKLETETAKIGGVDTDEALQRISGGKSQQMGVELDNALKGGNLETNMKMASQILENEKAKNVTLVNEGKISSSDAIVRDKQNALEMLNKAMNTQQMSENIKQKWNDLKIAQQNADTNSKNADTNYKNYLQNEVKNKIEEFKANIQSEYPGIQNTMGKAINDLMRWIEGNNPSDARKVEK